MPLVVIADDDSTTRRLVEGVVVKCGAEVAAAEDGDEALHLIQERLPALAILAISMSLRSGLEVGKELQKDSKTALIPIIFLTAHTQEQDVLEGFQSGAADYLFKPFSTKELQARVQAILARS